MFRDASDFTERDETKKLVDGKKIYVQGSIDLVIETADGDIILCDYKTDRVSDEERADEQLLNKSMKEKHMDQLEQYSYAARLIFERDPERIFIYSVTLGRAVEIK